MLETRTSCGASLCEACAVALSTHFVDLDSSERLIIDSARRCMKLRRGESLFDVGDHARGVYCLTRGRVKLSQIVSNGKERTIRLAGRGDLLGYGTVIVGDLFAESAVALEDSHVCFIPADAFLRVLESNQRLALRLLELLSRELRTAEQSVAEQGQKSVRERTAEALLHLRDRHGLEQDQSTLRINMTRIELAKLVGVATESVSRTLSRFQREELIALAGPKIRILNQRALASVAKYDV